MTQPGYISNSFNVLSAKFYRNLFFFPDGRPEAVIKNAIEEALERNRSRPGIGSFLRQLRFRLRDRFPAVLGGSGCVPEVPAVLKGIKFSRALECNAGALLVAAGSFTRE